MEMGGLTDEQVDTIMAQAEVKADEAEQAAADERRRQREQERIDAATAAAEAAEAASPRLLPRWKSNGTKREQETEQNPSSAVSDEGNTATGKKLNGRPKRLTGFRWAPVRLPARSYPHGRSRGQEIVVMN